MNGVCPCSGDKRSLSSICSARHNALYIWIRTCNALCVLVELLKILNTACTGCLPSGHSGLGLAMMWALQARQNPMCTVPSCMRPELPLAVASGSEQIWHSLTSGWLPGAADVLG